MIKEYWKAEEIIHVGESKSTPLHVDSDKEFKAVEQNPREKLTQVCEALDIDTDILLFLSNGFMIEILGQSGQKNCSDN